MCVVASVLKGSPVVGVHGGVFLKGDGELHKRGAAAGTVCFVTVQYMDMVAVFTKVHIHHNKILLPPAVILAFLPKEVNKLQNNSNDKKRVQVKMGVGFCWKLMESTDFS